MQNRRKKEVKVMKKVMLLVAVLSLSCLGWADSKKEAATDRLENASKVLTEIMGTPDKGIPEAFGARKVRGRGTAHAQGRPGVWVRRTAKAWRRAGPPRDGAHPRSFQSPAVAFGFQIGLEAVDLVMIFQGDKRYGPFAGEQVSVGSGCLGGGGTGGTSCFGRHRLGS